MGEGQPLVDPRSIRHALGVELAHRQHHLARLAVDQVAIVVDVHEIVIGPDLLDLRERLQQRTAFPETHVLDRAGVLDDVVRRELRVARQLALLDPVEPVGPARGRDVVQNERLLHVLLVRDDEEPLDEAGVHAANHRHAEVRRDRQWQRPGASAEAVPDGQPCADRERHDRHPVERNVGVDVRVRGAEGHAR